MLTIHTTLLVDSYCFIAWGENVKLWISANMLMLLFKAKCWWFLLFQAREIYEKAVEFFGEEYMEEKLFIAFAQFEEAQKVRF